MIIGLASEWIGEQVGGPERYATNLIRHVVRVDADNKFVIFVTPRGARCLSDLADSRVVLRPTPLNSRWYYVPFGLPLEVLKKPVDLLHATFTVVPWCPGKRIVLTVHDVSPSVHPEFFPPMLRHRYNWLLARGVARADSIIVPSEASKRELLEHYRVAQEKVTVIYEGVDDVFAPEVSEFSAPAEDPGWEIPSDFILYIGRFQMRKNLERLLEAFDLLRKRFGSELKLVLAGKDMWHQQRIAEKIQSLGLEKDVICPGYVPDRTLETLYRKARVFAYPSIHEGFGIPPLEAMARGVPVMASNRSAMPEILGDAAVYADPYDVGEMAHALERLLSDEQLRQQMIQRGKERIKRYSWQTAARETLDVYRATLAKGNGAD